MARAEPREPARIPRLGVAAEQQGEVRTGDRLLQPDGARVAGQTHVGDAVARTRATAQPRRTLGDGRAPSVPDPELRDEAEGDGAQSATAAIHGMMRPRCGFSRQTE